MSKDLVIYTFSFGFRCLNSPLGQLELRCLGFNIVIVLTPVLGCARRPTSWQFYCACLGDV